MEPPIGGGAAAYKSDAVATVVQVHPMREEKILYAFPTAPPWPQPARICWLSLLF